jgi:hypothetical protein
VRIFVDGRGALKDAVSNSRKKVLNYWIALNNEMETVLRGEGGRGFSLKIKERLRETRKRL